MYINILGQSSLQLFYHYRLKVTIQTKMISTWLHFNTTLLMDTGTLTYIIFACHKIWFLFLKCFNLFLDQESDKTRLNLATGHHLLTLGANSFSHQRMTLEASHCFLGLGKFKTHENYFVIEGDRTNHVLGFWLRFSEVAEVFHKV